MIWGQSAYFAQIKTGNASNRCIIVYNSGFVTEDDSEDGRVYFDKNTLTLTNKISQPLNYKIIC